MTALGKVLALLFGILYMLFFAFWVLAVLLYQTPLWLNITVPVVTILLLAYTKMKSQ